MKELSIEEKAKCYDEALEKSKILYEQGTITESLCYVFPELKESEDEKVRKKLINLVKKSYEQGGYTLHKWEADEMLAWLEKQGDQSLANKVEPKFHEGDWITNGDYTWKIIKVEPLDYILQSQDDNIVDDTISHVDEQFHFFTIEDAKDGDVLCCESGWTCIFKFLNSDNISFSSYCFMDNTGWFCETGSDSHTLEKAFIKAYNGNIYPATKEQRDLLFQKMKEAGYEWDAEKKELKLLITNGGDFFETENCEQEPTLSEEDNKWIESLIQTFEDCYFEGFNQLKSYGIIDWLKSLKERI